MFCSALHLNFGVSALLALLGCIDIYFINHAYYSTLIRGASVQLVFGFEVRVVLQQYLPYLLLFLLLWNKVFRLSYSVQLSSKELTYDRQRKKLSRNWQLLMVLSCNVVTLQYSILMTIVLHIFMKYVLHTIDLQSENPWDNKAVYLLYTELVLGENL